MLSVKFHNPDFPDGITFDIGGIAVPNGGSVELDAEQELKFYAERGQSVKDYFGKNKQVEVSGKSEITAKDKAQYNVEDDEVSSETIVDPEEGDPTVPEVDEETGEVKPNEEDEA